MNKTFSFKTSYPKIILYALASTILLFMVAYYYSYSIEIKKARNTENAIKMLEKIYAAQLQYKKEKAIFANNLNALSAYLDANILNATKTPYSEYLIVKMDAHTDLDNGEAKFFIIASPLHFNNGHFIEGLFSIYMDQKGKMRVSWTGHADAQSMSYPIASEKD